MTDLQINTNLEAPNFSCDIRKPKDSLQITLIVRLLTDCLKNKTPITITKVMDTYAEWQATAKSHIYCMRAVHENGETKHIRIKTKEDYLKYYVNPFNSRGWFKMNLGAAILKGKILAIPIIEI